MTHREMTEAPAIEVSSLRKRFGDVTAVDSVTFAVPRGELFGFLGPNGAGKSTTVRMLTGVIDPTGGTASIRGHDIRKEPMPARGHLAVVPEEANVYRDLSVWQNVMLMAELHGLPRRRRVQNGERLLEALGLDGRRRQKARVLSKGLRQRLMLCAALVTDPEILFLDEPTSGLDVHSTNLIRQIICDRNRHGLTVFLTTHDMVEAEELCSRIAIINQGRLAAIDSPGNLRARMRGSHYVEVVFSGASPPEEALSSLPAVTRAAKKDGTWRLYTGAPGRAASQVVRLADEKDIEITRLCTREPSLEEIFLHLTAEDSGEVTS